MNKGVALRNVETLHCEMWRRCTAKCGDVALQRLFTYPGLHNAVRNVKAIAKLLEKDYGLDEKNKTLILDQDATRAGILEHFDQLSHRIEAADSLIIVTRSGWGDAPEAAKMYNRNYTIGALP